MEVRHGSLSKRGTGRQSQKKKYESRAKGLRSVFGALIFQHRINRMISENNRVSTNEKKIRKNGEGLSFLVSFFVLLVSLRDSPLLTFNFWIDE